ncbi:MULTISPECIES: Fis family transcriptional regulator [Burkholderia cepacia complex]|nr:MULTISPECIES: Fis family transcriptional regulator [Burkholderia cepacia complex]MDN8068997.1 Fis family transcriptional regulator [Burkholderia vietnamiensis]
MNHTACETSYRRSPVTRWQTFLLIITTTRANSTGMLLLHAAINIMSRKPFGSAQARRAKALFLPMSRADADRVILQHRTVLEAVRAGYADAGLARRLFTTILLTRYLTEEGHGLLDLGLLDEAEQMLTTALDNGEERGDWNFQPALIDLLSLIVNEHDRQLRETRLQAIVRASERLDRLIESNRRESPDTPGTEP